MLTNFELDHIAKIYDIPLVGVFQKDLLPYPPKSGNYIVNLQSSKDGNGSHYCLLILEETTFYIDSFGAPPPIEIERFILAFKPLHYGYNKEIIQDLENESCGYYCLCFLLYRKHTTGNIFQVALQYINEYKKNKPKLLVLKGIYKHFSGNTNNPIIQRLYNLKK